MHVCVFLRTRCTCGFKPVDAALARESSVHRGPVEVARCIAHHSVVDESPVGRASEAMNDTLRPSTFSASGKLKDDAAAASRPAFARRAIQTAGPVKNEVADRAASVRSTFEAVKHAFRPCTVLER